MAMQNNGVCIYVEALMRSNAKDKKPICQMTTYYGVIQEIIMFDYHFVKYLMFKCDWVDVHKNNGMKVYEFGFIMVNLKRFLSNNRVQDDPFILASQMKQVFYVQDIVENDCYVVITCPAKGLRNSNTYELEYVEISSVADSKWRKHKGDESIGYGDMDYV